LETPLVNSVSVPTPTVNLTISGFFQITFFNKGLQRAGGTFIVAVKALRELKTYLRNECVRMSQLENHRYFKQSLVKT
jgi:hypothetical protein